MVDVTRVGRELASVRVLGRSHVARETRGHVRGNRALSGDSVLSLGCFHWYLPIGEAVRWLGRPARGAMSPTPGPLQVRAWDPLFDAWGTSVMPQRPHGL